MPETIWRNEKAVEADRMKIRESYLLINRISMMLMNSCFVHRGEQFGPGEVIVRGA
jgi:hypothetical protein